MAVYGSGTRGQSWPGGSSGGNVFMAKIRFSIALPPQDREWKAYLAAAQAADRMAFETFWSWDHLMPIHGDMEGPNFECYTTLSALAQATTRIRVGALVSGVAYRNAGM